MSFAQRRALEWRTANCRIALGERTVLVGILNVTPDSFSDGGVYLDVDRAVARASDLIDEGAAVIDVGGESTRPGASPLRPADEMRRVLPAIRGILAVRPKAILSIDTYHAETARAALDAGAQIVNDVSGGLWDSAMLPLCAKAGCGVILTHTRGRPDEWQSLPPLPHGEVLPLIARELLARLNAALAVGVAPEAIVLDPGFGFGKISGENFALLAGLDQLQRLGRPLLAGVSRKGFLRSAVEPGALHSGNPSQTDTLRTATTAAHVAAILGGVHLLRVHDVAAARHAARIADAVLQESSNAAPE